MGCLHDIFSGKCGLEQEHCQIARLFVHRPVVLWHAQDFPEYLLETLYLLRVTPFMCSGTSNSFGFWTMTDRQARQTDGQPDTLCLERREKRAAVVRGGVQSHVATPCGRFFAPRWLILRTFWRLLEDALLSRDAGGNCAARVENDAYKCLFHPRSYHLSTQGCRPSWMC